MSGSNACVRFGPLCYARWLFLEVGEGVLCEGWWGCADMDLGPLH